MIHNIVSSGAKLTRTRKVQKMSILREIQASQHLDYLSLFLLVSLLFDCSDEPGSLRAGIFKIAPDLSTEQ